MICGAESWNEIEEFGKNKFDFFKKRISDLESIPSYDTFNRFFSIMKPDCFELIFRNRVKQVCDTFEDLKSIIGVKSERIIKATGESTLEYRYCITSLGDTKPDEISSFIRKHWTVENNLHWQLDVTFWEDYSDKIKNAA